MIVDCFTFFNEIDILEVRLHTLAPYVDAFVLCEANRTFQGAKKPFWFDQSGVWKNPFGVNKPLYVSRVDLSYMDHETIAWKREIAQRQAIANQLTALSPDDRIILSDVDEIPLFSEHGMFPGLRALLPGNRDHAIVNWLQNLYYYWVNLRCWHWTGPVSCTWHTLRDRFHCDLQALRDHRHQAEATVVGGWHFSFLGGEDAILSKINAFSHTEYLQYADREHVEWALRNGWQENRDVFDRQLPGMKFELMPDDSHLPAYLVANKERFKDWWYRG